MASIDCLRSAKRAGADHSEQMRILADVTFATSASQRSTGRSASSIDQIVAGLKHGASSESALDTDPVGPEGRGAQGQETKDTLSARRALVASKFKLPQIIPSGAHLFFANSASPHDADSEVKTFLRSNKFLVASKRARGQASERGAQPPLTALLKNGWGGGKASVPDDRYKEFLDAYANDTVRGIPHFVSEQRSPVFRMHLDIDLVVPQAANVKAVTGLVQSIQRATALFYRSLDSVAVNSLLAVIVLAAQEKVMPNGRGIKQGLHLVMPNLRVNWQMALDMRETYLAVLRRAYGKDARAWAAGKGVDHMRPAAAYIIEPATQNGVAPSACQSAPSTTPAAAVPMSEKDIIAAATAMARAEADALWEKVVDHQIYTYNGLRMVYSHNMVECPVCNGKLPKWANGRPLLTDCPGPCNGMGRYHEARWYEPVLYFDGAGREDDEALAAIAENAHHCVQRTSIRCNADETVTPGWALYDHAPKCDVQALDRAWYNAQRRLASTADKSADGKTGKVGPSGGGGRRTNELDPSDPRYVRIADLLRTSAPPPHRNLDIKSVRRDPKGNYYIIDVQGEGSRACLNLPPSPDSPAMCGDHNSVTIFYQLSKKGLRQRCNCKCPHDSPKLRCHGPCSGFRSKCVDITTDDAAFFFGDVQPLTMNRSSASLSNLSAYGGVGTNASPAAATTGNIVLPVGAATAGRGGRKPPSVCWAPPGQKTTAPRVTVGSSALYQTHRGAGTSNHATLSCLETLMSSVIKACGSSAPLLAQAPTDGVPGTADEANGGERKAAEVAHQDVNALMNSVNALARQYHGSRAQSAIGSGAFAPIPLAKRTLARTMSAARLDQTPASVSAPDADPSDPQRPLKRARTEDAS